MKKLISAVVISSVIFSAGAAYAQSGGSIPLMQGRSTVTLNPSAGVTISLAKLTPQSEYQINCSIGDQDNSPNSKGAVDITITNAAVESTSINNVTLSNPVVNYVLQSQNNTLLANVTPNSRSAVLFIKNQSTVSQHNLTVGSCSATPVATSSQQKRI